MPPLQSFINRILGNPKRRIVRLWKMRPRELRTVLHIHDFEAEMWERGERLGPTSLDHHLALMQLLKDAIVRSEAQP
jgi:hypothetical protein